ncbi:MAG TPA: hypothetical protein VMT32_14740 [Bryobacteraceae bacterium]|nr:hypothetical protein [Bryobacteraceae bacterium]
MTFQAEKEQFVRMARNFFARFFENDLLSPQADFHATLSQALGLLASPGLFIPLLLLPLLMMDAEAARSWNIKLIFVFFSMLVMGVLSILEWDALMLDSRDQTILMPLPVRPRTMFAAKFAALAVFLVIFSVDVNAGSILMLPPLETQGNMGGLANLARFTVAHAAGTIGASAFTFLVIVSLEGILINTFQPKWFRRISTGTQVIAVLGMLAALFFFPAIVEEMPRWKSEGASMARLFPPMWFVGVSEVLQGTADPLFRSLARMGLYGLAAASACSVATYAVAYGRYTRASLEGAVDAGKEKSRGGGVVREALIQGLLRNPLERAIFRFSLRTMLRSPKHRLILAAYTGTGLALVLEESVALALQKGLEWKPAQEVAMLSLPLVISFFLLSGMRFIFNIPSELSANWIFQVTERREQADYLSGARAAMVLLAVAPVAAVVAAVYGFLFDPRTALVHAAYCSLLSLLLVEGLLWRLDKLPFTCSYIPGRIPVVMLLTAYVVAFLFYTHVMAYLEREMLQSGLATGISLGALFSAWCGLRAYRKRARAKTEGFVFQQEPEPVVCTLNLGS